MPDETTRGARALENEWMQAQQARDRARLEELVADGFRFTAIHLHPEPMTREQWMGAAMDGYTITTFAFEEMQIDRVRRHGGDPRALLADRVVLDRQPLERVPAHRRLVAHTGALAGRRPPLVGPRLSSPAE